MLQWLLLTSVLSISPGQTPGAPVDVATLKIGAPPTVAELDLGTLKGELRQLGWSPDGAELYVQTVDGNGPSEKLAALHPAGRGWHAEAGRRGARVGHGRTGASSPIGSRPASAR